MALIQCNFFSYELGMNTQLDVILPERRHMKRIPEDKKCKVVYALHGHAQDYTNWQRDGLMEHYLKEEDVIVVMPNLHRSFYTDGRHGYRYFSFLTKELPVIVGNYFPASRKREDQFIFGNSMGGYGALKAVLSCPEQYGGAACISGAMDPYKTIDLTMEAGMFSAPDIYSNLDDLFGSRQEFYGSENDLIILARNLEARTDTPKPKIFHCCGKQDVLYNLNTDFRDHFPSATPSVDYHYEETDGCHDWNYWNKVIPSALRFFGLMA